MAPEKWKDLDLLVWPILMLTQARKAVCTDLRSILGKIEAHRFVLVLCRYRPRIKMGISSSGASFALQDMAISAGSPHDHHLRYTEQWQMTSRRSVARHIIRHKAGKWALTFYVVNQSEQAVSGQWISDSGINKNTDRLLLGGF